MLPEPLFLNIHMYGIMIHEYLRVDNRGELIGLAFDGNWEAMSGDIIFEPNYQRCISVDVRYVLFIIDKFGGAGYLLDEMEIIK